jgi:hypothetical protein
MTLKSKIVKKCDIIVIQKYYLKLICNKTCIAQNASENNAKCIEIPALIVIIYLRLNKYGFVLEFYRLHDV